MKKLGLSIAVATAFSLSGCGGGGGSSVGSAGASSVSGTASKGIISGGLVSAYLFDDSGAPATDAIATAITDSSGDYTLNIPAQHVGKPVYVVVDDNDGAASMKCDIAGGCDIDGDGTPDAQFGEDIALEDGDLSMSAVLAEVASETSVNITPLTTVAAELVKEAATSSAVVNDTVIKAAANDANSQVADRFGLSGDVTTFEIVDLTDAADIAAADDADAVKYAALNAAIVSAVQSDDSTLSLSEAIETFADDFADNGLTDNAATESITDLGDILEDVQDVISEVETVLNDAEEDYTEVLSDIGDLETDIVNEETAANNEVANDEGDSGTPSETANDPALVQVKAFVEELRELGTAIDSSLVGEGEGAQTVAVLAENFELELDAADMASSDDVDGALDGISLAVEAITTAYGDHFDDNGVFVSNPSIVALPGSVVIDGITVGISIVDTTTVLVVSQNIDGDVELTASVNAYTVTDVFTEYDTGNTKGDDGVFTVNVNLDIDGSSSFGNIEVDIHEGSSVLVAGSEQYSYDREFLGDYSGTFTDSDDINITNAQFDLDVTIAQQSASVLQSGGAMTFEGSLSLDIAPSRIQSYVDNEWNYDTDYAESHYEETDITLGKVDLALSGKFYNDQASVEALFSLEADGKNQTFSEIYSMELGFDDEQNYYESESGSGFSETESKWAGAKAGLTFTSNLNGVADAVTFDFEVERTGYDDADASVELSYPGRTITIESSMANLDSENSIDGTLTLSNNDGVEIEVTYDEVRETNGGDLLMGEITLGDTRYATIELGDESVEYIIYSDGTFESLF